MYEKCPDIAEWRRRAIARLAPLSDASELEAQRLLSAATGRPAAWLLAHDDAPLDARQLAQLEDWLAQRAQHVPLAYLLGEHEFWSLPLTVTRDTLIPRPATESLVERALEIGRDIAKPRIADLGTGSGAIALALASELPEAEIVATDISPAALAVARHNAARHGLTQLRFVQGDWCEALGDERFDLIVSNPPYVESGFAGLADELRHEPASALVSGSDGLDDIRRLAAALPGYLKPGARVLIEHGHMQGDAVSGILRAHSLTAICTHSDLAQQPRFTEARRRD